MNYFAEIFCGIKNLPYLCIVKGGEPQRHITQ
nr:MAG TPA: hypothetical protein [Caudoviricetes sp.]